MKEESENGASPDFLQNWQNTINKFLSDLPWMSAQGQSSEIDTESRKKLLQETFVSIMKTWGAFSSAAISDPLAYGATGDALPDVMARFFQSGLSSFFKLQEQLLGKATALGKSTEAYTFENLDQDTVKAWSEFYKKEIRQYLRIPQLGLVRFYQERFNQVVDKYNMFNATFAEFSQIIMMPMEKTFKVMQDKIEEMLQNHSIPEDPHEFYRMWVKILEGHYMTLFKSPQYSKALSDTLIAYEEFLNARNRIVSDALQSMPIPTNKDLDELYAEIYHLKKRVKDMEKANKQPRKSQVSGG
jgi:polyhydroxyalkanoate synthase subunit PhaE